MGSSAERFSSFADFVSKAGKTAADGLFSPLGYGLELREDANDLKGRMIGIAVPFILPILVGVITSRFWGPKAASLLAGATWWAEGVFLSTIENYYCPQQEEPIIYDTIRRPRLHHYLEKIIPQFKSFV